MAANLIIVNGLPGTGKSTLASKLSHDLEIAWFGKDTLKEWLFDNLGIPASNDYSSMLGRTATGMLYVLAESFLTDGRSFIAENAYHAAFAKEAVEGIVRRTGARCIEVYCRTEAQENERRFAERISRGERHDVHTDTVQGQLASEEMIAKYAPLHVGKLVEVDTTTFHEAEYRALVDSITAELGP